MSADRLGLADPHCHTTASDGMVTPAELVAAAVAWQLDLIAITDHDTMRSAAETVSRGQEAGLAVVAGQEITTCWPAQTHVVGWFLERPVRSGMSLADTVAAIHDQAGLALIPHPFMPTYFGSCQPSMLRRLLAETSVDAIELLHTAPTTRARQRALEVFCSGEERIGALVASSDSHFGTHDLARRVTRFPGRSAEDFRSAVRGRLTIPAHGPNAGRVPLSAVVRQQRRSLLELPLRRLLRRL